MTETLLWMEEGDVFHLGGRDIEVIHAPGHSLGSVCLLDRARRWLFTGDTCCKADVLLCLPYCTTVAEYAATVEVNANTAMRSYDFLQSRGVVRIQRGIGYFVEPGAADRIRSFRREVFMNEELHDFFRQARSIGITADELAALYRQYCEKDHSFQ